MEMLHCDATIHLLLRYRRNNGCRIEMVMEMSPIAIEIDSRAQCYDLYGRFSNLNGEDLCKSSA